MLLSADSWERSIWSPQKITLIQGSTLTLQVWGKKNAFPLLARSILELQVETNSPCTRTPSFKSMVSLHALLACAPFSWMLSILHGE